MSRIVYKGSFDTTKGKTKKVELTQKQYRVLLNRLSLDNFFLANLIIGIAGSSAPCICSLVSKGETGCTKCPFGPRNEECRYITKLYCPNVRFGTCIYITELSGFVQLLNFRKKFLDMKKEVKSNGKKH